MRRFSLLTLLALLPWMLGAQQLRLLVGTYTEGTPAEGVYLYSFDAETADCQLLSVAPSGNPSFVISAPDGRRAYSVNEFNDGRQGVSAYAIQDDTIVLLENVPLPKGKVDGEDPCNLLCTGDALVSSNYTGGTVTAFPLGSDGRIGDTTQAIGSGREGAHMHCAVLSPDGNYIFVTNLGNDCIHRFERGKEGLPLGNVTLAWQHKGKTKFGPRHMVFSADGRFAYLLCELDDQLVVFNYQDGILTPIQTLKAYKGKGHGSADIHLSPDGRFLYTSHRLKQDGIAIFSVDPKSGKVKAAGYQPTGIHPRNFAISPDGRFLLCACRDSHRIEIYAIDAATGALRLTDKCIEVGAPVCVQFLPDAQVKVSVHETAPGPVIPAEIYGQFSEHLGRCIYEGLWVGPDSAIPNEAGYRTDVMEALKALKVPVLRWPGGCFADDYHWRDGIGPRASRPRMVNSNWGGTVEDNSFGTHEFLDFCERMGIQPYISGNVGSGSVEELAKWVEYMTAEGGYQAELRAENGRKEPWKVKYLGLGNEAWGCGGSMTPEYYTDVYRRYQTYVRDFDGNHLYKIASGANNDDYNWTRVLMAGARSQMDAISFHYYTVVDWNAKGSATQFTPAEYYEVLGKAVAVEELIRGHIAVMDAYDPQGRVDLLLDDWGTWFEVEPGTNPGHLYQQNTLRDAMVAALSLHIFHQYTQRLKMANIAQLANVLQAMVLTEGGRMVLTPTYHVFRMFNVHQNATFLPVDYEAGNVWSEQGRAVPRVSVSASRDAAGTIHVSLVNPLLDQEQTLALHFDALVAGKVRGEILTAPSAAAYNDFDHPETVKPKAFKGFQIRGETLIVTLPAASIAVLEI